MKVLITGTHFTPAQAVIEELKKYPFIEIIYIGRNHTMEGDSVPSVESEVLPKLGIKFISIDAGRLQRQLSIYTIPALLKIPLGFCEAFYYVAFEKPDLVVSFGGYLGLPVVFSAWLLSIPVIIHEQSLIPGLANKISSLFAKKIAVSFDKPYTFYQKSKIVITGNPLRKDIDDKGETASLEIDKFIASAKKEKLPLVVITGGNQGAHFINELTERNLDKLLEGYFVFHQTGRNKFNDFSHLSSLKEKEKNSERYFPLEWVEPASLSKLFESANLIISRAGINTLIEASQFNRPLLIIPLGVKEQLMNAEYFKALGIAQILQQKNISNEVFLKAVKETQKHEGELNNKRGKGITIPDANKRLTQEILLELEQINP